MSKEKLAAAKQFIEEKHYHEARVILEATHHPKATEWLAKLPKSAKSEKQKNSPSSSRSPALALAIIAALCFTFLGGIIFGQTLSQQTARNTQLDMTRTAIRTSNLTTEALIRATQTAAVTQATDVNELNITRTYIAIQNGTTEALIKATQAAATQLASTPTPE